MAKSKKKKPVKKTVKKSVKKSVAKRKAKKVLPIPVGYGSVIPYLTVSNGSRAIDFYKKVFNAKEYFRMEHDGKITHAELKVGESRIMLADPCANKKNKTPIEFGGTPVGMHLYVKDVDTVIKRAVAAGAKLTKPIENMFYGDRNGMIEDPFGHTWCVSTHIEDVTPAQAKKRAAQLYG